jgi:uncharacterized RDD family membrane protein YckC/ribosomal protein L40E
MACEGKFTHGALSPILNEAIAMGTSMSGENKFCAKCGAALEAGAAFCPKCGTPVGETTGAAGSPMSGIDEVLKQSNAQNYWVRRFLAFLIDVLIIGAILVVAAIAIAIPAFVISGPGGVTSIFAGIFSVVAGLFLFVYFIVAEVSSGATIGKRIFHLKVVAEGGRNPTFVESLVRNISKIYWILLLLDVIVGLATSKNYTQKFSDRMVGTSVVG